MPRTSDQANAHLVNHDLVNKDLLRPVALLSTRFFLVVAMLGMVVLAGFSAWEKKQKRKS